jgi:hypothetical protein
VEVDGKGVFSPCRTSILRVSLPIIAPIRGD